jgi:hypothetical protein
MEREMNDPSKTRIKLRAIVNHILLQECNDDHELLKSVLNRGKKSKRIVEIRRRVLVRLRSQVWQKGQHNYRAWRVCYRPIPPDNSWSPMSFPLIANHLGGNHTAWVKMSNGLREQSENATSKSGFQIQPARRGSKRSMATT